MYEKYKSKKYKFIMNKIGIDKHYSFGEVELGFIIDYYIKHCMVKGPDSEEE